MSVENPIFDIENTEPQEPDHIDSCEELSTYEYTATKDIGSATELAEETGTPYVYVDLWLHGTEQDLPQDGESIILPEVGEYIVEAGDTYYSIANNCNIPENPLLNFLFEPGNNKREQFKDERSLKKYFKQNLKNESGSRTIIGVANSDHDNLLDIGQELELINMAGWNRLND